MRLIFFLVLLSSSLNATEYLPEYQRKGGIYKHFTAARKECCALIKKLFVSVKENSVRDPNKPAVLLVHGLNATPSDWYQVMDDLNNNGFEGYTVALSYWPKDGYQNSVEKIDTKIHNILKNHPKVAVVGHSLGGVAALDAVNQLGEDRKLISKVITVNSPLRGTTAVNNITRLVLPKQLVNVLTCNSSFVKKLQEESMKTQEMGVKIYHTATESDHLVCGHGVCFLPHFEEGIIVTTTGHLSSLNEPLVREKLLEWLKSGLNK